MGFHGPGEQRRTVCSSLEVFLSPGYSGLSPLSGAITHFPQLSTHDEADAGTLISFPMKCLMSWELEGSQSYMTVAGVC